MRKGLNTAVTQRLHSGRPPTTPANSNPEEESDFVADDFLYEFKCCQLLKYVQVCKLVHSGMKYESSQRREDSVVPPSSSAHEARPAAHEAPTAATGGEHTEQPHEGGEVHSEEWLCVLWRTDGGWQLRWYIIRGSHDQPPSRPTQSPRVTSSSVIVALTIAYTIIVVVSVIDEGWKEESIHRL